MTKKHAQLSGMQRAYPFSTGRFSKTYRYSMDWIVQVIGFYPDIILLSVIIRISFVTTMIKNKTVLSHKNGLESVTCNNV